MKDLVQKSTLRKERKQDNTAVDTQKWLPNSMLLTMMNSNAAEKKPSLKARHSRAEELGKTIRSRLPEALVHPQGQIPAAETEADQLSAHVQSTTPLALKEALGRKLGADFSAVRFHTDYFTAARVDSMGAKAYTSGSDVYFSSQGFDPEIAAHELVHTVQQGAVPASEQTVSAPLGGVQMWPWSKKKKEASVPAANVNDQEDDEYAGLAELFLEPKESKVPKWMQSVGKGIGSAASWVGGKAKAGASWLGGKAKAGASWLGNKASAAKDKVMEGIGNTGEGLISKVADSEAMGNMVKKSDGFFSGIFDWSDRRSGEKVDPKADEDEDMGLANLFQEPESEEPKKESKLPKWMQSIGKGVGKAASWVGNKAKAGKDFVVDKVAGGLSALKRNNDRAVDSFNNHRADYENMSSWDKFMWSVKNPLARLTAEHRQEGTKQRNARNAEIDSLSENYREGLTGRVREAAFQRSGISDTMGLENLFAEGPQPESQAEDNHPGEPKTSALSTVSSVLGAGSTATGKLGGNLKDHYKALGGETGGSLMSKSQQGFGATSQILGGLQNAVSTVSAGKEAYKRYKIGDRAGAACKSLNTLGQAAKVGKGALTTAQYIAPAATAVLSNVNSGIDIGINALDTAAEGTQAVASGIRMKKMGDRSKAYEERVKKGERLSERDEKMRRIARQGKGAAKADLTQHSTAALGSGLKTAGGISTVAGAPPLVGTALGAVGTGVSAIGGMVAGSQRSKVLKNVVEEETALTKRIERIKRKNPGLSDREAKHVALKGLGFSSGRQTEAAQHFTIERADFLSQNATSGDTEAAGMLSDMGVRKTKDGYNRELIGERLGMKGIGTLEQQKQATIDSRRNPFARKKKKTA